VRRILKDKLAETAGTERPLTAVINAKGGAGGSTVAGNLAHLLAAREGLRTALLDLDLQFGAQTQQFDLHPQQGLLDALAAAEGLDEVALAAYMAKHPGGLHILGRLGDQILLPAEVADRAVEQVLELAQQAYRHVVVDLPRLVDPVLNRAVERASTVLIVLQQSFAHLRDGKRLARLLTEELELRPERIEIVVNRYEPKAAIRIDEIERALGREVRHLIPNDYRPFHAAGNLGMPVSEYAPQSPGTRALGRLAAALGPGGGREDRDGLLRRFLGRFGREG
jgi:pilus assembly protein CpaE